MTMVPVMMSYASQVEMPCIWWWHVSQAEMHWLSHAVSQSAIHVQATVMAPHSTSNPIIFRQEEAQNQFNEASPTMHLSSLCVRLCVHVCVCVHACMHTFMLAWACLRACVWREGMLGGMFWWFMIHRLFIYAYGIIYACGIYIICIPVSPLSPISLFAMGRWSSSTNHLFLHSLTLMLYVLTYLLAGWL